MTMAMSYHDEEDDDEEDIKSSGDVADVRPKELSEPQAPLTSS